MLCGTPTKQKSDKNVGKRGSGGGGGGVVGGVGGAARWDGSIFFSSFKDRTLINLSHRNGGCKASFPPPPSSVEWGRRRGVLTKYLVRRRKEAASAVAALPQSDHWVFFPSFWATVGSVVFATFFIKKIGGGAINKFCRMSKLTRKLNKFKPRSEQRSMRFFLCSISIEDLTKRPTNKHL